MSKRVLIWQYKRGSDSAIKLAKIMNVGRRTQGSERYREKEDDILVNWGCSRRPLNGPSRAAWVNPPEATTLASNKLKTFRTLSQAGVRVPGWTTSQSEAQGWADSGKTVVCRGTLTGHSGRGISIFKDGMLVNAPLYTKYVKKNREVRVHVFRVSDDRVHVYTREKRRCMDVPDERVNWMIRNNAGGFNYCDALAGPSDAAEELANQACKALGLDFCAVDVLITASGKPFVLEVNTAPGLTGSTKYLYAMYLSKIINARYGIDI